MREDVATDHSALKPYEEMLVGELHEGISTYERSSLGLFVSSVSAGMDISFSVLLIVVAHSLLAGAGGTTLSFVTAGLYPVGFVFVILGRAELFTEQTTLAIVPVLHGRASIRSLFWLWAIVYVGNLLGIAAMMAGFTVLLPALELTDPSRFERVAQEVFHFSAWIIVLSGIFAGWLMGLLSWLLTATRDTISQIVLVWLIAMVIGMGGLHHSIVGAGEVLGGMFSGHQVSFSDFGRFLLWVTIGNTLGGFIFALLLKYSEGTRGARLQQMAQRADSGQRSEASSAKEQSSAKKNN